jgi:hypothetical protein
MRQSLLARRGVDPRETGRADNGEYTDAELHNTEARAPLATR